MRGFNRELFAGMWLESRVFSPHSLTNTECEETTVTEDVGIFSLFHNMKKQMA
jgi:hypothetical protein